MPSMAAGDAIATPQNHNPRAVVRIKAASVEAGVSTATLRRLCASGRGPRLIRVSERCLGIRRGDLDAWLTAREISS